MDFHSRNDGDRLLLPVDRISISTTSTKGIPPNGETSEDAMMIAAGYKYDHYDDSLVADEEYPDGEDQYYPYFATTESSSTTTAASKSMNKDF